MLKGNTLLESISEWYRRNFSDPSVLALLAFVLVSIFLLETFGNVLMPILISMVLAYVLNTFVVFFIRQGVPKPVAIYVIYLLFLGLFLGAIFYVVPAMWRQLMSLLNEVPLLSHKAQGIFSSFIERYPHLFEKMPLTSMLELFKEHLAKLGQLSLSFFLGTIPGIVEVILYVVLVPILVFFFLKDSEEILQYFTKFMPRNRGLLKAIWEEMHVQIGHYLRGRVLEVVIVSLVAIIVFNLFGLKYATLLGALVGISAIVPYVGIVLITIPVVTIAIIQWGISAYCIYVLVSYFAICLVDANILVPLLFSETMSLHPLAIIVAILFFGSVWGFWGVFFAIPLATFVRAVINVWPTNRVSTSET